MAHISSMQRKVRRRWPWYLPTALMVVGLIGWIQPAGANNSDDGTGTDAIVQPYDAGSADGCGSVSGDFYWSPGFQNIYIAGTLIDRPATQGSSAGCGQRETIATFTAYAGAHPVVHTERVNDAQRGFTAPLSAPSAIDRVVVRICRVPTPGGGTGTCGAAQVFQHP